MDDDEHSQCAFCRATPDPASSFARCGGCKRVRYCFRTCQSKHWKARHKQECKQLQPVTQSTATNEKACESPSCPRDPGKKLRLCSVCKCVYYCSKECQQAHYKKHKALCKGAQSFLKELGDPAKVKKNKCQREHMERVMERLYREADAGDAVAQSNLGVGYSYGYGVPQDYEKAVKLDP